jgi:hypothetical protein
MSDTARFKQELRQLIAKHLQYYSDYGLIGGVLADEVVRLDREGDRVLAPCPQLTHVYRERGSGGQPEPCFNMALASYFIDQKAEARPQVRGGPKGYISTFDTRLASCFC